MSLVQQRRMLHRLAAEHAALQARHRGLRERSAASRERLLREAEGVEGSVQALGSKAAHFSRADAAALREVSPIRATLKRRGPRYSGAAALGAGGGSAAFFWPRDAS